MSPMRLTWPRYFKPSLVEGGLIFAVLYGLAVLTRSLYPEISRVELTDGVLLLGALFFLTLVLSYQADTGAQSNLKRQTLVFAAASFILGVICFSSLQVLFSPDQRWSSLLVLEAAVAVPTAVALWRWVTIRFGILLPSRERIAILGTGESARDLCRLITERRSSEYAVVGFIDEDGSRLGNIMSMGARVQADYGSLTQFTIRNRVNRIIVSLDEKRGKLPLQGLMEVRLRGIEVEEATTFVERIAGKISVETMLPSWLIFSDGFKTSRRRVIAKRAVDLSLSLFLLALSGPLMLVTAILIRLEGPGPILYRQGRIGRDGREITVLKFRSMGPDAERRTGPVWAKKNDPRVTRIGRVVRKLRIDELPQLFNVLRGEMSIVGPRPERPAIFADLREKVPTYQYRQRTRPGITGLAQINQQYDQSLDDVRRKVEYDLEYIKKQSLLEDLRIIIKTLPVVLFRRGGW